jgi:hypothetical protein
MLKGVTRSGLIAILAVVFSLTGLTTAAYARGQQQKPAYTYAEYNAYQAAAKEKIPAQRIKLLDDFVSKFPKSTLLPYIYQSYYQTYDELKNYPKVIEYADKLIDSTDKAVDNGMKLRALYTREVAFNFSFNTKAADAAAQAQKARADAAMGLKLLAALQPPKGMTEAQFKKQLQGPSALFSYIEGLSALYLKDYPGAVKAFHMALESDPTNPVTYFRLGIAYLEQATKEQAAAPAPAASSTSSATPATTTPASTTGATADQGAAATATLAPLPGPSGGQGDFIKGFWALARSLALKEDPQVKAYLQNQMLVYQKTACQDLLTAEMTKLLQMAQTTQTIDPPAGYTLPSGVQLSQYLQSSNLFNIMQDLQSGGDRANFVWLAVCGNEFPMVPVKVISVTQTTNGVDMQVYSGPTPKSIQSAKTANMDVNVVNQPDAQRLQKDNIVRFTGTLTSYDPAPNFLLHWDKAQVNPADIPPATPGKKRPAARHHR